MLFESYVARGRAGSVEKDETGEGSDGRTRIPPDLQGREEVQAPLADLAPRRASEICQPISC